MTVDLDGDCHFRPLESDSAHLKLLAKLEGGPILFSTEFPFFIDIFNEYSINKTCFLAVAGRCEWNGDRHGVRLQVKDLTGVMLNGMVPETELRE